MFRATPPPSLSTHPVLLERRAVRAVRELRSGLRKLGETRDGEVLLVRVGRREDVLGLLDGVEDVRLAVVVAVRADAEVDLARVLVRLERLGDTCQGKPSLVPE